MTWNDQMCSRMVVINARLDRLELMQRLEELREGAPKKRKGGAVPDASRASKPSAPPQAEK